MTMAWSSLLMLSLIPALSLASSEAEAEPEAVNIQIGGGTSLNCKEEPDKWIFNETTVISETDDGIYKLEDDGQKLKLSNIQEVNLGLYKCVGEDDEVIREFEVVASFKLRSLPKSISVDDGTPAVIECIAKTAADDVIFKWFTIPEDFETNPSYVSPKPLCAKGSTCFSADDVQPEALFDTRDKSLPVPALEERAEEVLGVDDKGQAVSRLTITPAYTEDRQYYVCQAVLAGESAEDCTTAENKNCDEEEVLLRVKDPLAALYPFVGIVAEVIVLCIVIFFCERSKSDDKEDYEGVTGNGNPATSSNSNLRQRK